MKTRIALLALVLIIPFATPGCILAGAVGYGVLFSAADKGTKYRYDAPLDAVRGKLDTFCHDEALEISMVEDGSDSALRKGMTSDNRRVRIEALPWNAETTIVFIRVGVSGDTYAAQQLHERFSREMAR
jgi:hypothetical protein